MASKGSGSGGERTVDDFGLIAALVGGLFIVGWILWVVAHDKIAMGYTYARRVQLGALDFIGSLGLPGAAGVHEWFQKTCAANGLFSRCTRDFSGMRWSEIANSSMYVNIVLIAIIIVLAARMFLRINATHPNLLFSKVFSVDSFVRAKKPLYRHLRMFDAVDLIAAPLTHDAFGMSQTSRQFAFHHRLIVDWIAEPDGSCTPTLDRVKTERIFRHQLGKLWTGPAALTPGEVMLLAIAAPRVAATDGALNDAEFKACVNDSDRMIDWCWDQFKPPKGKKGKANGKNDGAGEGDPLAWLKPEINLDHPHEIIAKYIRTAPMQAVIAKHAYARTILFAAFTAARRLGVLPPAEMRWLRFYDRTLWYVLQNFGRQGAFAEGAAPHVHYLYEIKSNEPLPEPQLDKAISALEVALTAFKYKPVDRDRYNSGATAMHEAVPPEALEAQKRPTA